MSRDRPAQRGHAACQEILEAVLELITNSKQMRVVNKAAQELDSTKQEEAYLAVRPSQILADLSSEALATRRASGE